MSKTFEEFQFEFYLTVNEDGYRKRHAFVRKLNEMSGFQTSVLPSAAGSSGMEQWLITIIGAVSSVTTIADFLYKYFRRRKKKNATYESIRLSIDHRERIPLNNLTREELIKVIETRSSYRLIRIISHESQKSKSIQKNRKKAKKIKGK